MSRLQELLQGEYGNYLAPFYWQTGDHTDKLREQMRTIYSQGIRAVTVESRVHPDFCRDGWWRDLDIILDEAEKLGMKVWILDDYAYPTGKANNIYKEKYPHLRPKRLIERHVDVMGPKTDCALIRVPDDENNELLGVYAYQRSGKDEELCGEPKKIDFTKEGKFVTIDLPEGMWRVFFYTRSYHGTDTGLPYYADLISAESVSKLIEAVYQPHFDHYEKYFGKTLLGFFSDEPCLANRLDGPWLRDEGMYRRTVGMPGLTLPWSDELKELMAETLGTDPMPYLCALWYRLDSESDGGMNSLTATVRHAYMDAVTRLWSKNFQRQLRRWCHDHGVEHIGHVIEDMNAHARLGCSGGHYFRSLENQDMSGIDIVMQQVMPEFEDLPHTTTAWGNYADPVFFRYVLPKLASSLAHLTPHMHGRAMCETFGAYGWAEGVPTMKWLADFLLVNGLNFFVPHAYIPKYPLEDAPPYFGMKDRDPQFAAFGRLMEYMNKTAHLLSGALHCADAAVLYHAEGEWMNGLDGAMLTQVPAQALAQAQIDYDIVSADMLEKATVGDRKLQIGGEEFSFLVVPYAPHLPASLLLTLSNLSDKGLRVIFAGGVPDGCEGCFESAAPEEIPALVRKAGLCEIGVREGDVFPQLKIYHALREDEQYFMFTNLSTTVTADTVLELPCHSDGVLLDLLDGQDEPVCLEDGSLTLKLEPYCSRILVVGDAAREYAATLGKTKSAPKTAPRRLLKPKDGWKIELIECSAPDKAELFAENSALCNITGEKARPDFSGFIRYTATAELGKAPKVLDLGEVGVTASLTVNGKDCGMKICPPYRFDISKAAVSGENEIVVTVANTYVQREQDVFSRCMTIPRSGLLGPVKY